MPKLERSDLSKLTENDIKAILFLIHACAWLPDNKAICDAIGNLKGSCEYELEKRRTEIE